MIWNDRMIHEWASNGGVTPFDDKLVNPASIDLRLGNKIRVPHRIWSILPEVDMQRYIADGSIDQLPRWDEPTVYHVHWLFPGRFVLCHSHEFVQIPTSAAAILFLKSSQGRLGINHSHSGWGDPGFGLAQPDKEIAGASWTFEIQNISPWPLKLTAGKPLIQMVMMNMAEEPKTDYRFTGHYVYQSGPTIAHRDMEAAQ